MEVGTCTKPPLVVGLTGGIGTGKSTVARGFQARGAAIIDADQLAHEVLSDDASAVRAIADAFGTQVLEDGKISRPALGRLVFAHHAALRRLELIVHPKVCALAARRLLEAAEHQCAVAVYDVPLLVETGAARHVHTVVVVTAPWEARVERLAARSGLTRAEAVRRLRAQTDDETRLKAAHHHIQNDSTLEALEDQISRVWAHLTAEIDKNACHGTTQGVPQGAPQSVLQSLPQGLPQGLKV